LLLEVFFDFEQRTHFGIVIPSWDLVVVRMGDDPAKSVGAFDEALALIGQAKARVADLDSGDGVLLLTDLFGATPANLSRELLQPGRVAGAAGVSLPMLLRAVNYRQLPLEALRDKALTAATECSAPLP
jgi:PTS system ascorbate-specific IIA component